MSKKTKKETKKPFNCYTEFTLYLEGEPKVFKSVEDFTKTTGISGAVALDLIKTPNPASFKGWHSSREEEEFSNDRNIKIGLD